LFIHSSNFSILFLYFVAAWGPLKEEKESRWSCSRLLSLINPFASSTEEETDAHNELMKELLEVRKEVYQEYQWFSKENPKADEDSSALLFFKRKRLLRLFVKDLSSGICGIVISNKEQRDSMSSEFLKNNRVAPLTKSIAWVTVILMNFVLLFYVYLFAMNQTRSRQSAWFQSFVMWAVFEIVVSSTGLVLCIQILIPLYVLTEVTKVKEKVLNDMLSFRQKYLKQSLRRKEKDEEASQQNQSKETDFNAAKYLFTSWRVASLFRDIPESGLVLKFSTPWPKKKFGSEETTVTSYYEQDVFWTALSRVLIFFITPFLHLHTLTQDIITQMICNTGIGYLCLSFIRLYQISPLLPLAPVVLVFLCVHFLVRSSKGVGKLQKFGIVHPKVEDETEKEKEDEREKKDDNEEDEKPDSNILDLESGKRDTSRQEIARWDDFVDSSPSASESSCSTHPSREGDHDSDSSGSGNSSMLSSVFGLVFGKESSRYLSKSEDSGSDWGDSESQREAANGISSSESNKEKKRKRRRRAPRGTNDSISVGQNESDSLSSDYSAVSMDIGNIAVVADPQDTESERRIPSEVERAPEIDIAKWLKGG
jgi:hypothetical protein